MCVLAGSSIMGTGAGGGDGSRSVAAGGSQKPPPMGICRILIGLGRSAGCEGW